MRLKIHSVSERRWGARKLRILMPSVREFLVNGTLENGLASSRVRNEKDWTVECDKW